ncbi:MAG: hypothetical protein AVDCRST_MAG36-2180 [uncultured Nocardioidaceae bacterium]|uniref:Uncharacterized protein n=1 Tax=uncultured Nocardioidaceae bacterium TaxID=253824 RepID=A0A6J4MCA7_9ACTN|nr:MAG: hypothetical protein AVDCRST_MAG36-2180 [uncultured Nocardioidaceae bacterium]
MQRGVYFDAWFPRQHCYHPSLPPRRLRMIDDLADYRATVLVWSALGGGSLSLPYLEQEAFGPVSARDRFYGFVNDSEFIAACRERGIKVFGIVFEAQGWEFPVELSEDESEVLALNELRGVGTRGWLGLRELSSNRYPALWPPVEHYFPDGLVNSRGEAVVDLIEECVARDIHQQPCHARWVECPDREHQCFYMDRNNPVWREYLKAVIRIQVDAGVDGVQLDEAELPMGAFQYGACFCFDCLSLFRSYLQQLPADQLDPALAGADLETFHYGDWLLERGHDFGEDRQRAPLWGDYYRMQCQAIERYFGELAAYTRSYAGSVGREVLVSGNFFSCDPSYLALSEHVDLLITEMRNTTYRQPEWYRYVAAFAAYAGGAGDPKDVVVVENPYGGVVPELVALLGTGRGHDLFRLSIYEGAAFGAPMSVPYGAWMGSTIEDSYSPPHALATEVSAVLAERDRLFSKRSWHEVAVAFSVASTRELIGRADASDNLTNAVDASVRVPYRVATEALSRASVPFDVVILADGVTAPDKAADAGLSSYRTVVLPDCVDLTTAQAAALEEALGSGTVVVVTDRFGETLPAEVRDRLLQHPGVRRGEVDDVATLAPSGPQVEVAGAHGVGVNIHRVDGGAAVHLVNYDVGPDGVQRTDELVLTVRLPGSGAVRGVVLHPADSEPVDLPVPPPVAGDEGVLRITVPSLGVYATVEVRVEDAS